MMRKLQKTTTTYQYDVLLDAKFTSLSRQAPKQEKVNKSTPKNVPGRKFVSLALRFQNQVEVNFVPLQQKREPLSATLWFLTLPGEPNYDETSKDRELQQVKLHLQRWWVRSLDSHKLHQQKPRPKSAKVSAIVKNGRENWHKQSG